MRRKQESVDGGNLDAAVLREALVRILAETNATRLSARELNLGLARIRRLAQAALTGEPLPARDGEARGG